MKYTIKAREERTTNAGKPYASVTFVDDAGAEFPRVGVFENLEQFTVGGTFEGELYQNDKGYWNVRTPRPAANAGRTGAITQAQNHKAELIQVAQENKERGIKIAGAMRDATLMVTNMYPDITTRELTPEARTIELRRLWLEWKEFFLLKWDDDTQIPF